MTDEPKTEGVAIQLAVLSTKLDGIQTSLNDKFTDMRGDLRELKNNTDQKFASIETNLDKKATHNDINDLRADLDLKVSMEAFSPVRKIVYWMVSGVGAGALAAVGWLFTHVLK